MNCKLQNVWFWECEEHPDDSKWEFPYLTERIRSMVQRLNEGLKDGRIHNYLCPQFNLVRIKTIWHQMKFIVAKKNLEIFLEDTGNYMKIKVNKGNDITFTRMDNHDILTCQLFGDWFYDFTYILKYLLHMSIKIGRVVLLFDVLYYPCHRIINIIISLYLDSRNIFQTTLYEICLIVENPLIVWTTSYCNMYQV